VDACPNLSWRDVKWLIANTSTKIDQENPSWIKNSAGLTHSIDYGYGKINPLQMIEKCRSKYYQSLPEMQYAQKSHLDLNTLIPDTNTTVSEKIELSENLKIEWVGLSIDTNHPFAGDLEISLISPSGTRTSLIKPNEMNFAGYQDGFRLSSVAFVDENSLGMWNVEITDRLEDDAGTLKSLKLEVYGYKK
jgi:kexin